MNYWATSVPAPEFEDRKYVRPGSRENPDPKAHGSREEESAVDWPGRCGNRREVLTGGRGAVKFADVSVTT